MALNTIIGLAILATALIVLTGLTFWARGIVEKIARENLGHLRDYMRKGHER